ncbi:ArsA family ATPase [[Eubacterium] cellulosolvens]
MKKTEDTKIISFWGKGGVGKTTCSVSYAIYLANQGFNTLLITSDPTPSLSDILNMRIGAKRKKIGNLSLNAIELDEETITDMWKKKFGAEVYKVISAFLPVENSIIDYVAGAPGIADEFMLSYILDLYKTKDYDYIIWDTAPAGGTLRLIKIQEKFYEHLGEAAKLYLTFKTIIDKIRQGEKSPLEIIESWRDLAQNVLNFLSSRDFSAHVVTVSEWLGLTQTRRIIDELKEFNINIGGIIVNQIIQDSNRPLKGKPKIHQKYLKIIDETYSGYKILKIPIQHYELRGINQLYKFSKYLTTIYH